MTQEKKSKCDLYSEILICINNLSNIKKNLSERLLERDLLIEEIRKRDELTSELYFKCILKRKQIDITNKMESDNSLIKHDAHVKKLLKTDEEKLQQEDQVLLLSETSSLKAKIFELEKELEKRDCILRIIPDKIKENFQLLYNPYYLIEEQKREIIDLKKFLNNIEKITSDFNRDFTEKLSKLENSVKNQTFNQLEAIIAPLKNDLHRMRLERDKMRLLYEDVNKSLSISIKRANTFQDQLISKEKSIHILETRDTNNVEKELFEVINQLEKTNKELFDRLENVDDELRKTNTEVRKS